MVDKKGKPDSEEKEEQKPPDDVKPKRTRKRGPSTKTRWGQADVVKAALTNYFNGVQGVVAWVNPVDGQIIAEGSEAVIHELVELGRVDRNFRKALEKLAAPGKYGPLFLALTPMAIALAANHNLLPQLKIFQSEEQTADNVRPISEAK